MKEILKEMYADFTTAFTKEERNILKVVFFVTLAFIIIAYHTHVMVSVAVMMVIFANNLATKIK